MRKIHAITPALVTIMSLSFLPCVFAQSYTIRQEIFTCRMAMAQAVTSDTFIITRLYKSPAKGLQNHGSAQLAARQKRPGAVLAVAHFKLGSFVLSSAEIQSMHRLISTRKIDKHTPLIITGYTCALGNNARNLILSRQRADAVARILQAKGFNVAAVQGKGSMNPLTDDPAELYMNRRVEIAIRKNTATVIPVSE